MSEASGPAGLTGWPTIASKLKMVASDDALSEAERLRTARYRPFRWHPITAHW